MAKISQKLEQITVALNAKNFLKAKELLDELEGMLRQLGGQKTVSVTRESMLGYTLAVLDTVVAL